MNVDEHAALVGRLPPSQRRVYDAVRQHGPLDDHGLGALVDPAGTSGFRGRRRELAKMGLVRAVGKRRRRTVWGVTPAADVEAAREQDERRAVRRRPVTDLPLEVRVNAFLRLADDKEVQDGINDPEGSAKRRQRSRLKAAVARNNRERRQRDRELREAIEKEHPSAEAMRFRNSLRNASELIRALRVLQEEERERRLLLGEEAIPDAEWVRVLRVVEEGIREHEEAYETIARMTGAPSRRVVDIEVGEDEVVEDAEYEIIAALGEGVSETP